MIDEHRKVMGSHQISIRAADLLEDMRPQHYNGMNRAQTVRTINDILQGRTERTVDAFLVGLRNTGGEDYAQRVEEISREDTGVFDIKRASDPALHQEQQQAVQISDV